MALTSAEEAQTRELLAQQAAILSLADSEPAIISNLGATDVSLSDLAAATVVDDTDLLLIRQGVIDKSVSGSIIKGLASVQDASTTVKGIVELATVAEAQAGTDTSRAVTPAGLSASAQSVVGSFSDLKASATGTSATVTVTADEIVVKSASNAYKTLRAVSLSINSAAVGANGLDIGTLSASTWYAKFVIWNGTTAAGLLSLSETAPTLPSGYTHYARTGWVRTDGTANKFPLGFTQIGRRAQYLVGAGRNLTALPIVISGIQGTVYTTLVAGAIYTFVPTTAASIGLNIHCPVSGSAQVSPNSVAAANASGIVLSAADAINIKNQAWFNIESSNIYYASNIGSANVTVIGWEDNL